MRLDRRRVRLAAGALALGIGMAGLTATGASAIGTQSAAPWADGCYTWDGGLSHGDEGDAVKELQTRVAGWSAAGAPIAVDGVFGDDTQAAIKRFQKGYGLEQTGKGDTATYEKIYELQSDDCSPAHFTWDEFASNRTGGFAGGNVSEAQVKENVLLTMWKLEALRHKMGDAPIQLSSVFRTVEENADVGGVPNSNHTYGTAADLIGSHSFCDMAVQSQDSGFNEIIGPGAPNHDDHTHVATRSGQNWNAPDCF